jgi:hypothetical protein
MTSSIQGINGDIGRSVCPILLSKGSCSDTSSLHVSLYRELCPQGDSCPLINIDIRHMDYYLHRCEHSDKCQQKADSTHSRHFLHPFTSTPPTTSRTKTKTTGSPHRSSVGNTSSVGLGSPGTQITPATIVQPISPLAMTSGTTTPSLMQHFNNVANNSINFVSMEVCPLLPGCPMVDVDPDHAAHYYHPPSTSSIDGKQSNETPKGNLFIQQQTEKKLGLHPPHSIVTPISPQAPLLPPAGVAAVGIGNGSPTPLPPFPVRVISPPQPLNIILSPTNVCPSFVSSSLLFTALFNCSVTVICLQVLPSPAKTNGMSNQMQVCPVNVQGRVCPLVNDGVHSQRFNHIMNDTLITLLKAVDDTKSLMSQVV